MKKILRILVYITGMAILSLGTVVNTKTGYGVSPITALPYALSIISEISLGTMTATVFIVYVFLQMVLIRHTFRISILIQIPVTILFGKFTNVFNDLINYYPQEHYIRIPMLLLAILLCALGIMLTVNMAFEPLAADGLTNEIASKLGKSFGFTKNVVDMTSVILTVAVGLILEGSIIGVGIGTVAATLLIGRCIAMLNRFFEGKLDRLLTIEGRV